MKSKNLSESILRSVKSKGFKYIDLPSVIEANHIVQRSGENFRKFIFSFTDQNGSELCLRPDLTIASCLRYLENNLKGKEKIFYSGQAYRKSQNKKDSIIRNQIGFEILDLLRNNNINAEIFLDTKKNLGKQLTLANKRELDVAIICGENEFNENTVTIKNLKGVKGENNKTFPKENLIDEVKKLI